MALSCPAFALSGSRAAAATGVSERRRVGAQRGLRGLGRRRRQQQRLLQWSTTSTPPSTSTTTTSTSALPTFLLAAAAATTTAATFEPQLSPAIAVSAAVAVVPPIVYWLRVWTSVKKRLEAEELAREEEEERERARLERLRRLKGE